MSGQKISYARITTDEYSRLVRGARVAENMDNKIQQELRNTKANLQQEFNSQINSVKKRNKHQEKMINNLSSDMQSMERDFQEKYRKQVLHNSKVDLEITQIHKNLQLQREEYTSLINEQNKVFTKQIKSIQNSIENKEKDAKKQALEWLKNAKDSLALVDTYNHNKFTPNEYNDLEQKINLIETNIKNENYEIGNAQNVWMDSYKLRAKLEELENEWNAYFELSLDSNAKLLATCEAQKIITLAFDTEEATDELEVEIDYWCNGKLKTFKEKALEHTKSLKEPKDLEIVEFKNILQESATLQEEVLSLTEEAKEAIILSQLRSDMASDIVESLDESGFELVDSCFEEDERKSIHLKLQNISGDEVVTIITPIQNRENRLDIHFFDDNNEDFKQTRLQNMMQRLTQNGIECQKPQCAKGTENNSRGDESVKDFEKVKEKISEGNR